jgi:hypothetical protein
MLLDSPAGRGNFPDYRLCDARPRCLGIKIPIASRSAFASGDQISGGLSVATMAFSGQRDQLVYVEFPSATSVEGSFASVYLNPEAAKLFHVGKQLPADGFLIGFRQRRDFFHGLFHDFCHT